MPDPPPNQTFCLSEAANQKQDSLKQAFQAPFQMPHPTHHNF